MNRVLKMKKEAEEVKSKDRKFGIPILLAPENGFENHNWFTKIVRIPMIWVLNALPIPIGRFLFLAFSGSNGDTRIAFRWPATYKPLERMYTFYKRRAKRETNTSDNFWELFLDNSRAIRNRLKVLKQELPEAIQEVARRKGRVNLLSLGSGSARGVFKVVSDLNSKYPTRVELIDMSRRAINFSKKLALSYGISDIKWHRDLAQNLEKYCKNSRPDIVEVVGLLDYFPQKEALELVRKIYKALSLEGWLFISNIIPNMERLFVSKVINWPLIYRTPTEIGELLLESGFRNENIKVLIEPLKVYALAVCRKKVV